MLTRRTLLTTLGAACASPALAAQRTDGGALVRAARLQIGVTKEYDHAYRTLAYPGGDVPQKTGVCADVIVRAARTAWKLDLQRLVHEDMQRDFAAYPTRWGLKAPDPNIDHRRVPNLETFLTRRGAQVWHADKHTGGASFPPQLQPGDILTWRSFPTGGPHIAIVSRGGAWPKIIQNHGWGTREDWLIQQWLDSAEGHFRWRPVQS